MRPAASAPRTSHSVVLRIEALQRHAADVERHCTRASQRATVREVVDTLQEARAWLRAAAEPEPVLVTHVARMVSGASDRLYAVVRFAS